MTRALVTGTSSGIGLEVAVGLGAAGLDVVATLRDPSRADDLRRAAEARSVELEIVALDVTDPDACERVVSEAGPLDLLVNNAGRGSVATLEELTDDALQEQLEVNLLAVARLARLVLPGMRERGRGRIVTVTSVGGLIGQPFSDAYCASKFAVEGLMQSLAPVAARFGVEVSVVEPAAVASGFVESIAHRASVPGDPLTPLRAAYLARSERAFASAQPAAEAARVVVEAAITDTPRFRWQTSEAAAAFATLASGDLDGSRVLAATSGWLD